ncbi:aminoglycoside phosphotransferase family protein [Rubritalea marina]|uniref:aminoglycoside phosphotransferase family protein n=1 Tax=Rubritalea marina TaxID=361055 RepID=UPI000372945C|nr:phosphotransferase [Rubritalea marina]
MPTDTLLTATRTHLELEPTHSVVIEPIVKGGSGRTIVRIKPEGYPTYIGIYYTLERADNANYLPVSKFLKKAKLNVPEVLYDNIGRRCALIEDLGEIDLHSLKGQGWELREPIYRSALEQLDRLFYTRAPKDLEFQPPFDPELYKWEQDYFFDNFAEIYLGMSHNEVQVLREHPSLKKVAESLGASARHLVHRDFQSQNIIVRDGKAFLIDFQGMRRGRQEYDIASLIFDPYMNHSAEEREKLLDIWEDISEERPLDDIFFKCATQRLMQALGAYGNLVSNKGEKWFEQHIPTACSLLADVIRGTDYEEAITPVLEVAKNHQPTQD